MTYQQARRAFADTTQLLDMSERAKAKIIRLSTISSYPTEYPDIRVGWRQPRGIGLLARSLRMVLQGPR